MKKNKIKYKSVFISDIHLGTVGCHAKELHDFLKHIDFDNLFLVGDIVDFWRVDRKYWNKDHSKLLRYFLKASGKRNVFYIPGNHDECIMEFLGDLHSLNFIVKKEYIYEAINEKKYLITHGDKFDLILFSTIGTTIAKIGSAGYDNLIKINTVINSILTCFGLNKIFLSKFIKENIKKVNSFVNKFEMLMTEYCKEKQCNGIICGHIHVPLHKIINNIEYINCGDWVENLTAVVETLDGEFKILQFHKNENNKITYSIVSIVS